MVTFLVALRSPGFSSRWCIATFLPLTLCQTQIKQYINQKSTPTYGPDIRRVKSFQSAIGLMVRIFAFQAKGRGSIPRWRIRFGPRCCSCVGIITRISNCITALIAQLGERQTEDLKVSCSIHDQGISFSTAWPSG